ncbi:MAG TPA: DUF4352 domain-containing protein [Corynebacterium sp.]|uniref:hypothetical protein n=1 Tax=Corynebacterium sp. TaxID=1720 RepID=UPI0017D66728|nr:hypothetical protein [Corynebacterium sp.]HHT33176.1 DUF4352 domain-containing protein [Corynebacterium sp.]
MTWTDGARRGSSAVKVAVIAVVFALGVGVGVAIPSGSSGGGGFGGYSIGDADPVAEGADDRSERRTRPVHGPSPGQPVEAPGITLTIDEVTVAPARDVVKHRFEVGVEGPVTYVEQVDARPGGTFATVRTTVVNTGDRARDLVCGYDVRVQLVDDLGRRHERVDALHDIPGNPVCDDMMNPGFSTSMTWIFEVPEGVVPASLAFADTEEPVAQYWFARLK